MLYGEEHPHGYFRFVNFGRPTLQCCPSECVRRFLLSNTLQLNPFLVADHPEVLPDGSLSRRIKGPFTGYCANCYFFPSPANRERD